MASRALISKLGDVDIRLLRVFVTVCECNGIAASERELNVGKSTISKHVTDLERRIGLRLCDRGPSGFRLTSEGQQVLDLTHALLSEIDAFRARIDDIHKTLTGTLRLGIFDQSSTNPDAHVDVAIGHFDTVAPGVVLKISLDTPSALETAVADGNLDLAIVPIYRQLPALAYHPLYREEMTLYCGRGHGLYAVEPVGPTERPDLSGYKYAGYSFNSPNMRAGRNLGVSRSARVEEEEALVLLIQSGRYLGYLADHVAARLQESGEIWPVFPEHTAYSVDFAAVTRTRPAPERKTETLLRLLKEAHAAG